MNNTLRILFYAAIGIWVIVACAGYSQEIVSADFVFDILIFGIFFLAVRAAGEYVLGIFLKRKLSFLVFHLSAFALGSAMLSSFMFFVGVFSLYYPLMAYIVLFGVAIITYKKSRQFFIDCRLWAARNFGALSPSHWILLFVLFLIFSIPLVLSWLPPSFYDTLVYNLGIPKRYALFHSLKPFPYNYHAFLPQNTEMLYTFLLLLKPTYVLPQLLNAASAIFGVLSLYALARRWLSRRQGLLASVIYISTPAVLLLASVCKADSMISFFAFLSLIHAFSGNVFLSAVFVGWMCGAKYTSAFFALSLLIALFVKTIYEKNGFLSAIKTAFVFGVITLAVASPWFIRSAVLTGNPVYPALADVFSKTEFQGEKYAYDVQRATSVKEAIVLPVNLTLNSANYGHLSEVGFLYLAFLPLIFLARGRAMNFLLGWSVLFYAMWAFSFIRTRHLFPALGVWAICAVAGAARLSNSAQPSFRERAARYLFVIVIAIGVLTNLYYFSIYEEALFDPLTGLFGAPAEREDWFAVRVPYHPVAVYANENLSPRSKILLIGETRTFYLNIPYESDTAYDKTAIVEYTKKAVSAGLPDKADKLLEILTAEGFTHILINKNEISRLNRHYGYITFDAAGDARIFIDALSKCELLNENRGVELWEIGHR